MNETRYKTLVIDPPWDYKRDKGHGGWKGTRFYNRPQYTVMTLSELEVFGSTVNDMADPNGAAVFCWTTPAFLHDALHILDVWGWPVTKNVGVWVKSESGQGLGVWARNDIEYWIWAVRGDIKKPERPETNVVRGSVHGHSVKPQAFYDMVERISPGPYLDMFGGRSTLRFNWDFWGDGK